MRPVTSRALRGFLVHANTHRPGLPVRFDNRAKLSRGQVLTPVVGIGMQLQFVNSE